MRAGFAANKFVGLWAAVAFFGFVPAAGAVDFQISALGLDTLTGNRGVEFNGMLRNASGDFFIALPSLADGINVCALSATFRDNDASHDVTATIERRVAKPGGTVDTKPQIMAKVASSGAQPAIRKRTTQAVNNSKVDTEGFAYFVRVALPAGNSIDLVKLDLDLRIIC